MSLRLIVLYFILLRVGLAQNDFSDPITCYICNGTASNSTCADPIDVDHPHIKQKECDRGICLKWTKYRGGELQMIRTCSSDLNFHLTMIDGVCRTERYDNGWLCMCGKHLCNGSPHAFVKPQLGISLVMATISLLTAAWTRSR